MDGYDVITNRLLSWANDQDDVRAVIVVGSRARADAPADDWSDLDLLLVTSDPERYLTRTDWLDAIGTWWVTFIEPTLVGGVEERRVLFEGALDVDFVPFPLDRFRLMLRDGLPHDVASVLARGVRVLLDKDAIADALASRVASAPAGPRDLPSERAFANLVSDFWYHAVWTSKKLMRGEVWTALGGLEYMRNRALLPMLAWHARSANGAAHDTWHAGRFVERWADPRAARELAGTFSRYDRLELERALRETMRLFGWLAAETAARLGYAHDARAEALVTRWVTDTLRGRAIRRSETHSGT